MPQHEQKSTSNEMMASQEAIRSKTLDLKGAGDYANVSLRETLIENEGQYPSGVAIRAQLTIGENCHYLVATHGDMIGLLKTDNEGMTIQSSVLDQQNNERIPLYDEAGKYVAAVKRSSESALVPGDVGVRIDRHEANNLDSETIRLTVAETTRVVAGNVHEDAVYEKKNRRRKKLAKTVGAVAIAYSVFSSGGTVDSIADGFNRAHDTVNDVSNIYTLDSKIDGIRFGDMPNAETYIAQMNRPSEVVAKVMDDLDGHRYADIRMRSQEYIANHGDEFVPEELLEATKNEINESKSVAEVLDSVDILGDYYGITFRVSTGAGEVSTAEARNTIEGVVDALSELPRSLIHDVAQLENVTITAFEDPSSERESSSLEGQYSSSKNEIRIHAQRGMVENLKGIATIPGVQSDFSVKGVFLHEFGHALDEKTRIESGNAGVAIDRDNNGSLSVKETAIDFIRGGIAMYPESISTYARTNPEEHAAENIAGILDVDRSDGIAHPDEARRFNSPANKDMLRTLVSLERVSPGIADYLVEKNNNLMSR
jgi:hypothetical protein